MDNLNGKRILISRTDSIGDVVLTLPMCVWIKEQFPEAEVLFLGMAYTQPIISCLPQVDELFLWNEWSALSADEQLNAVKAARIDVCIHVFPRKEIARLMKKAGVPIRVGTSHRAYHWLSCNRRVSFTRKNSPLHEAQLNFSLLRPFGLNELPSQESLTQWITNSFQVKTPDQLPDVPADAIILHPKSRGSAIEWPMASYVQLAHLLLERGQRVLFCGTEEEGRLFRQEIPSHEHCIDLTGKLTLHQYLWLISQSKALVACSTGPYHLAGITNIKAIGLFVPRRPIHPGRWKALGQHARALVADPFCPTCVDGKKCLCIEKITPEQVLQAIFD